MGYIDTDCPTSGPPQVEASSDTDAWPEVPRITAAVAPAVVPLVLGTTLDRGANRTDDTPKAGPRERTVDADSEDLGSRA